ncbi:MAG: hypothetical protein RIQ56_940 [Candidatus Parcubacteria bacterium]|jgi:serine/threonine protein phosphatase PrpC
MLKPLVLGDREHFAEGVTKSGLKFIAGCDKGFNYKINEDNEDRVVICPEEDCFAAIDGMGGLMGGKFGADTISEALSQNPRKPLEALNLAQKKMKDSDRYGAACIMIAHAQDSVIETYQAGDVKRLLQYKRTLLQRLFCLKSYSESEDQTMAKYGRPNVVTKKIDRDECCPTVDHLKVAKALRLMLYSDGVSSNINSIEMIQLSQGRTLQELFTQVWQITEQRMKNNEHIIATGKRGRWRKTYCDGFSLKPRPDNRSFVAVDF